MLIEDKIRHSIIKACELDQEKEEVRYIIPHLYTAAKLMYQYGQEMQIEDTLFLRVNSQFKKIHEENQQLHLSLDQVHIFMDEEIQHFLQRLSQWRNIPPKMSSIHSSRLRAQHLSEQEQALICIPQETYFFGSSCHSQANQAEINQNPSLGREPSLQAVPTFLHKQSQCTQRLERVDKLYRQHRLDQAYQESLQCKKKIYLSDPNLQVPREAVQMLKKIQQEYQMMTYFYQFFNEPGYIFDKQRDNVSMHYKLYEESKEVSVRVQAEIDISIENFLCIVSEVDLFQEYIPFTYGTKQLRALSRNQKIGLSKVYLPLLSDRIAYFYAAAYDRLSTHNSIFFFSKTITSDQQFQRKIGFKIEKEPNYVQLEYKFYIMEYIPLSANRGKIRLATNINLRLGFLPFFIINKTCRIFAFDFFQHLVQVNKNFKDSKWQKKMQDNKNTYNFFKQRIQQFLEVGPETNK